MAVRACLHRSTPAARSARGRGFTLIEVLVSLLILSVLAATAWKGMDAISSARRVSDENLRQTLRLQSVITQFEADLAQVVDTLAVDGMQFDGAHLRLTRRAPGGVQVVVWYVLGGHMVRWASPVTTQVGTLQKYWLSSYLLKGSEPGTLDALEGVQAVQAFCFRGGSLSNCQSTGNVNTSSSTLASAVTAGGTVRQQLPDAVRLQVTLGEGSGFQGTLTRDILLGPQ